MKGEWIRKPSSDSSVVFVHGILSGGETCWLHENGTYWPYVVNTDSALNDLGIYVYTYQTNFFSGTYNLGDIVDDLKERLQLDGVFESHTIFFICHSMGGIVVRKFIVERAIELIERNVMIGLFLLGSPSLGSDYATWLEPLARVMGHSQADALRFSQKNVWLNGLDKEFLNHKEAGKLNLHGKELIEDKFVRFKRLLRKQVVEPFSGARYFGEPYKVPGSDHFSIVKVKDAEAIQHRLLRQFINDTTASEPSKKTGDEVIDKVINTLKPFTDKVTDDKRKAALAPLFDRAAFHAPRQTDWNYFLYAICRTRLLLESQIKNFDSPTIRTALRDAVNVLLALECATAGLYGLGFSLPHHINHYIHNSARFINELPTQAKEPAPEFLITREKELAKLREILHEIGV